MLESAPDPCKSVFQEFAERLHSISLFFDTPQASAWIPSAQDCNSILQRYGSLRSAVFQNVRDFTLLSPYRWISELEAFANLFGGTCHSFTEVVPLCREQLNYCWSRKSKHNYLKGFGDSEEACPSAYTSRQSQFRIDRFFFIESTNPIFITGVLSFFYHLPAALPLLVFPLNKVGTFWAAAVTNVLPACQNLLWKSSRQLLF